MATLESLQATLAKYEAERDRILTSGSSFGVDGTTRSSAALETIAREIEKLEHRIAMMTPGGGYHTSAVFGGRG
jgi:copper homeostasis protein CutC